MPKIGQKKHGAMQRARAIVLRERGMSYAAIGTALGISKLMAHRHVRRALEEVTAKTPGLAAARRARGEKWRNRGQAPAVTTRGRVKKAGAVL